MSHASLRLSEVRLVYPGPPEVAALDGIDLEIRDGEFVAVVGPSGAGKSSLLHVLGLLTTPTSGALQIGGRDVAARSDAELTRLRANSIGFVFQAFHLLDERTVLENVALPLRYQRVPAGQAFARARAALEEVGLGNRAGARAKTLSGGERQRVAIARSLVTDPAVLLCDEPTGNLDSANSKNVLRLLRELHARGRTIVLITHDEQIAASVPRVVRILDGRCTSSGVPAGPGRSEESRGPARPPSAKDGRLRLVDVLDESVGVLVERRWRTLLTCLGTVLGVATLVAIVGLTATASAQISKRFDRLAATTVAVQASSPDAFAPERIARVAALNGVRAVAYLQPVDDAVLDAGPASPEAVAASSLPVVTATPESWDVVRPTLAWGRYFDGALRDRRVVVLGAAAARQAGVYGPLGSQSVLINGHPYLVIGVIADVERRTDLLLSAVIPTGVAEADFGPLVPGKTTELVVETAVGAGPQVAREVPYALVPEDVDAVDIVPPPDPRDLREKVALDLTEVFLVLGAVTLLVGMVGIANTSLIAVMERVPEIGLRRALGAQRRSIRNQFLTESALIGAAGGLLGSLVGLVLMLGIAVSQEWTPVLPRLVLVLATPGGALVGALAGYLPARRAARTDPTAALRSA